MEKLYSKCSKPNKEILKPKPETIKFLLDYSKALSVVNCKSQTVELLLN